jgi:hypothetical protein
MTQSDAQLMKFEDRLLEHLRIALIMDIAAAGHDLGRRTPTAAGERPSREFIDALDMLDSARSVLYELGFPAWEGDCAYVDVDKHGQCILSALLSHAHGERDRIADEAQSAGGDEAAFDSSTLEHLTRDYAEIKEAIEDLKARGVGVLEQVAA